MKLPQEMRFVDEMSLRNWFTLSNSKVLRVFLIVSDFCTSFPNLVNHRSAYLWPTSFERQGDVVWKSCLFPRTQSSFRARCWVPMKQLQRSCAKLKLCTGLTTHAAYLKLRPWHPASVESNSSRQEWANKHLKHTLEFDSTAAVRPGRGCFLPQCRTRRRLCGREPPGPDPHTTLGLNVQSGICSPFIHVFCRPLSVGQTGQNLLFKIRIWLVFW